MSFPGPGQSPNNNGGGNNPFTNPFGRNNNAGNGKDSNGNGDKSNGNGSNGGPRPFWQSPWLWVVVVALLAVTMFQIFAGTGSQTIDTKDGLQILNGNNVEYAQIVDNTQQVKLKLKSDYSATNPDTGRMKNYGKNVQFYYTYAQSATVVKAVQKADPVKGWTATMQQSSIWTYLLTSLLPFLIIFGLFWFMMSRMGGAGGMFGMGGKKNSGKLLEGQTPTTKFADVAGEEAAVQEVEEIKDFLKDPSRYKALGARIPRGVLLYGPPGNGKTLIAKAVANALAEGTDAGSGVFLSVKGPELLNKFVGESERLIRMIFKRARERAADGKPVIVFIDEMDSLLRTRGTGVSSDVETTIVPQFLTELDGVESLDNVMVIGASNRIDMIDPAVLRPGRLDVKIRVDRPGIQQATQIVRHYLTDKLPLSPNVDAKALIGVLVNDIYAQDEHRHLCDICDDHGQWRPVYLADVVSGAVLKNIVDRAKTYAVKLSITTGQAAAIGINLLAKAVDEEYGETRDALLDADPEQWSRINGLEPGRVTGIRPVA